MLFGPGGEYRRFIHLNETPPSMQSWMGKYEGPFAFPNKLTVQCFKHLHCAVSSGGDSGL